MHVRDQSGRALPPFPFRLVLIAALAVGTPYGTASLYGQAVDPLNSSKVLNLTTFAAHSSVFLPESAIDLTHPKDGSGRIFVSTNEGRIQAFSSSGTYLGRFLDLNTAGVPDFEDALGFTTNGLSYIAFHPNYGTAGAPGEGKLYTIYKSRLPGARDPATLEPGLQQGQGT